MKYLVCGLLLLTGISTLAISFRMHAELQELARSPMPVLKDRMVRHIFPTYPPTANPKPAEIAQTVTTRIYGIGALGVVLTVGAFGVLVFMRNAAPNRSEPDASG